MAACEERRVARWKEGPRGSYSTRTKPCVSEICRSGPYVWRRGKMERKGLFGLGTLQHPLPNQAFPSLDQSFIPISSWSLSVFLYQRKANHPQPGEEDSGGKSPLGIQPDSGYPISMDNIPLRPVIGMKLYSFLDGFPVQDEQFVCHLESPVASQSVNLPSSGVPLLAFGR